MTKPHNPPAFPGYFKEAPPGMTLRDYFAAAALQGFFAARQEKPSLDGEKMELPKAAYYVADAMLKAREVEND